MIQDLKKESELPIKKGTYMDRLGIVAGENASERLPAELVRFIYLNLLMEL